MEYNYDDKNWSSPSSRLDVEFAAFNALKTILEFSGHGHKSPTNGKILEVAKEVSPEVFDNKSKLLEHYKGPDLVREFQQKAVFESKVKGEKVEPLDLLNKEVETLKSYLKVKSEEEDDLIKKRLERLEEIKPLLREEQASENEWILRDLEVFRSIDENDIPTPPIHDRRCKVFQTSKSLLKIRRLHPDKPEHLIGADLIYERYKREEKLVRVVHIQYKIWDDLNTLYFSKGNVKEQIDKLKINICDRGFCDCKNLKGQKYRLPYCSAFLRPTNKLQNPDKRIISKGLYVPICVLCDVLEDSNEGNKILRRTSIVGSSLNQDVFERMFHENMLGSEWLKYDELEVFYRDNKILQSDEKLIYHAQDYQI